MRSISGSIVVKSSDAYFIEQARVFGDHLVDTAVWWDQRCNWLDYQFDDESDSEVLSYGAISVVLYDGVSGIALFLSELCSQDGDEKKWLPTIAGCLNQIEAVVKESGNRIDVGLFDGLAGIIYASSRIWDLLKIEKAKNIAWLAYRLLGKRESIQGFDIISGLAGLVAPIKRAGEWLEVDEEFNEYALKMALELASRTRVEGEYCSWPNVKDGPPISADLIGFAHGTSGCIWSLNSVANQFDNGLIADIVRGGIAYENLHYNEEALNWPDFRLRDDDESEVTVRYSKKTKSNERFMTAWCHGAIGVGLSRLAIGEIEGAAKALKRVVNYCDYVLHLQMRRDFSLCHGLTGAIDFLLECSPQEGDTEERRTALSLAEFGINKYGKDATSWPCGLQGANALGLMTGISGIGLTYLRIARANKVPSILLPGAQGCEFSGRPVDLSQIVGPV